MPELPIRQPRRGSRSMLPRFVGALPRRTQLPAANSCVWTSGALLPTSNGLPEASTPRTGPTSVGTLLSSRFHAPLHRQRPLPLTRYGWTPTSPLAPMQGPAGGAVASEAERSAHAPLLQSHVSPSGALVADCPPNRITPTEAVWASST